MHTHINMHTHVYICINHIHNHNMRLKQERYGNATLFHVETARSKAPGCSCETEEKRRGRSLGGAQRSTTASHRRLCRLEPLCAAESDGREISRSIPTPRVLRQRLQGELECCCWIAGGSPVICLRSASRFPSLRCCVMTGWWGRRALCWHAAFPRSAVLVQGWGGGDEVVV